MNSPVSESDPHRPGERKLRIGWITLRDLRVEDVIGGGLQYRRFLLEVLQRHHKVDLSHVAVPEAGSFLGKMREKILLARRLQQVAGTRDAWIRDFRELAFLGANRTRGRQIALLHHIDSRYMPNRLYNELCDRVAIRRLRSMDTVVTVSRHWQERVRGYGARDVRVIYNAIAAEAFVPPSAAELQAFRRKYGLGRQPLIYIGNCRAEKGADRAVELLRDEGYQLVTSGPCRLSLDCPNLELPYDQYVCLLWAADVALLLSRFAEGWCISAHEAMMCRTPVIGSGRGGMRELLEGGGQIVTEDAAQIRAAVRGLVADRARNAALGEQGRCFAAQFTRQRFAQDWLALLAETPAGGAPDAARGPQRSGTDTRLHPARAGGRAAAGAPRVSLILPVYNREAYLADCLKSILWQTFTDFELIAVDDGSGDRSLQILREYAEAHPDRIRILQQENAGPYVARNLALRAARGELIAFADSDDRLHPQKLARQVAHLERAPEVVLVYTHVGYCDAAGRIWTPPRRRQVSLRGDLSREIVRRFGGNIPWPTVMVRRSAAEAADPFDTAFRVGMDREWGMRIAQQGPFDVIEEPLYEYRLHEGQISQDLALRQQAARHVLERISSRGPCRGDPGLRRVAAAEMHLQLARLAYLHEDGREADLHWRAAVALRAGLLVSPAALLLRLKVLLGRRRVRQLGGWLRRGGRPRWTPPRPTPPRGGEPRGTPRSGIDS